MALILTDDDIGARLRPDEAVRWMRDALVSHAAGDLHGPPRVHAALGHGRLVFTAGAVEGVCYGFRAYDTFGADSADQVVVVHDRSSGRVEAVAVGSLLGQLRTGALGGVAVDLLADPDADRLGVVGSGHQAWAQVWAISAVRPLREVAVYSRTAARAAAFARRVRRDLGIGCAVADSARAAVEGRPIVVLATDSTTPVIDPGWLASDAHVTTVGPKQVGGAEFDVELVQRCAVLVTDSVDQLQSYDPPTVAAAMAPPPVIHSMGELAAAAAGQPSGDRARRPTATDGPTLYLSVGLAGTEVYLLHQLAGRVRR